MKCMVPTEVFTRPDRAKFCLRVGEEEAKEMFNSKDYRFIPKKEWKKHQRDAADETE